MNLIGNFLLQNKSRVLGLDIVRAIAIMIVAYEHSLLLLPSYSATKYSLLSTHLDGVSIFFVLSGFLIGGILLKIVDTTTFKKVDLLDFWIRRWFRTLPNYFFILGLLLLYRIVVFRDALDFSFLYLFFLQNFSNPHPGFFAEAWSLCVEEWFYLLFPFCAFLLIGLFRNKKSAILFSAIFFMVLPLVMRILKYESAGFENWDESVRKVVIMRLDALMYGVVGAYFYRYRKIQWSKYKKPALIISFLLFFYLGVITRTGFRLVPEYLHFNIESVAVLLMLPFFSELKQTSSKAFDFSVTFISVISYSMYLLNLTPIQKVILPVITAKSGLAAGGVAYLINYLLYWILLFAGSYLLYHYFEKPATKLRDKIKVKKQYKVNLAVEESGLLSEKNIGLKADQAKQEA